MDNGTDPVCVLHVDDDPDFAALVADMLEREDDGFAVETATSADEGLDRLAEEDVDCVVSDYDMPGRTGIEFLEAVREDYPDLPFILFTGKGSETVASDAISAGVTDYLQKESGTGQYAVLANRIRNAVEKHKTQAELDDRERRLTLFFEQSPLGVIEWDETFRVVRVNDAAEDILGYSEGDLAGRSWEVIVPESDRENVDEVVSGLLENEGGYRSVNENVRKDGERITCEWHNRVVTDGNGDGDVVGIFSQFQDVTQQRHRERAVEELHRTADALVAADAADEIADLTVEAVRDILDMPVNGVFLYDESADRLSPVAWTCEAEDLVGEIPRFERGEGLAWDVFETGEARLYDDVSTIPERANSETNVRSEIILPLGDHGVLLVGSCEPDVFDETDASLVRTLAAHATTALDLVDRRRELREERAFVEQALDALEDLFYVVGPDGELRRWNDRLPELTGYADGELAGMQTTDLFPEGERERVAAAIEETMTTGHGTVEADVRTADGDRVPYELTGTRLVDADGTATGLVGIGRDVSDRERRERKLAALHDVADDLATAGSVERVCERTVEASREILAFDLSVVDIEEDGMLSKVAVSEDIPADHTTDMSVSEEIAGKTYRTGESFLIDDLLALAREGERTCDREPVDLGATAEDCWETVATGEAALVVETDRTVRADPSRLRQLLENLLRNAVKHGSTSLDSKAPGPVERGDTGVTVTVGDLPGGFYVEGDGPCIPESERDEAFESGYSTGGGTGLGLSIVRDVADAHGWTVAVTDGGAGGARFEVTGVDLVE